MRRAYVVVSAMTMPLLMACAQKAPEELAPPPGGGDSPTAAHLYFDGNVKSMFESRCASCHASEADATAAPDYLGFAPEEYYPNLVSETKYVSCNPENSLLLNKGFDPGHPGGDLTLDERQKVETWLEIEANERFNSICGGTTTPPPTSSGDPPATTGDPPTKPPPEETVLTGTKAMEQFGECMSYTDWVETGMPLVTNQNSNLADITYNDCYSCHNAPQGMNLMPNPDIEAEVMKAHEYMRKMYASFNLVTWTVNDADGSFKDLVKSNRWRDKGVEAQAQGSTHPAYELTAERQGFYEAWFDKTYAKWKAGNCTAAGTGGAGGAGEGGAGGAGGAPEQ